MVFFVNIELNIRRLQSWFLHSNSLQFCDVLQHFLDIFADACILIEFFEWFLLLQITMAAPVDIDGEKKHVITQAPPPPVVHIANPVPLGLMAFGTTTFVLSCYNAAIFGVHIGTPPNVVIGMAIFYGGIAQFLAGMWEFRTGNTFAATAFGSYGAFWLSYAAIYIPWFNVADSYSPTYEGELGSALGIFLLGWTLFTFFMWFGTLRANVALFLLFTFLTITFALLTITEFKRGSGHHWQRVSDAYKLAFFDRLTATSLINGMATLLTLPSLL